MSLSILFHGADDGDDGPFSLCSAAHWNLFKEWVADLPEGSKAYKELVTLCNEATVDNTVRLSQQLEQALEKHRPKDLDVRSLALFLSDHIGPGHSGETCTITDE